MTPGRLIERIKVVLKNQITGAESLTRFCSRSRRYGGLLALSTNAVYGQADKSVNKNPLHRFDGAAIELNKNPLAVDVFYSRDDNLYE
jgi:hypothetical protein